MEAEIDGLFYKEYDCKPQATCSAPGVLHLLGEHAEFARGHVLSLALPLSARVAVSRRTDSSIRMYTRLYDERKRCSVSNLKFKREDRWANLLKAVLAGLDTMGCSLTGLNILVDCSIPDGRGLGASSAICLAATLALCQLYSFKITDAQTIYIAHTAETQFINRPNQVSTCYTSIHAHAGAIFSLDLRSLEYRHLRLTAQDLHFYLIDSMVPPVGAMEEFLQRQNDYVEVRGRLKPMTGKRDLRDISSRELKELVASLPEGLRRICMHISSEEERHHQAVDSIESGQVLALGKILHHSHESLRDNYEVSCPEIDWLAKHHSEIKGCLAIRLTGKGFGASAVLVAMCDIAEIEASMLPFFDEYERIFGFQAQVRRIVVSGGALGMRMGIASAKA